MTGIKKLPESIDECTITFPGDPTVGIATSDFTITGPNLINPKSFTKEIDFWNELQTWREELSETFEGLTGEPCRVMFDFEYKEESDA
jgi:hypothetical protein